jgi:hypothetical protein
VQRESSVNNSLLLLKQWNGFHKYLHQQLIVMPTYPVINLETKEKKTLYMSMKAYSEWKEENPGWDKDWSEGCAGQSTEFKWTGEAKSNGWNEVLDRASKQPGANVRKNRYYG